MKGNHDYLPTLISFFLLPLLSGALALVGRSLPFVLGRAAVAVAVLTVGGALNGAVRIGQAGKSSGTDGQGCLTST